MEDVRLCALRYGVDATALLDLKRTCAGVFTRLFAYSKTGPSCAYEWNLGFALPYPHAGRFQTRCSGLIPQKGFCLFNGSSPLPGYPDDWFDDDGLSRVCQYQGFGFIGDGRALMDVALDFCDHPKEV